MKLDPKKAESAGQVAGKKVNSAAKVAVNATKQMSVWTGYLLFNFAKGILGR